MKAMLLKELKEPENTIAIKSLQIMVICFII
jgi:hypothetical protein